MRIIYLSTRSVTYVDPEIRYVARLHDRYLENKKKSNRRESFYIYQKYQRCILEMAYHCLI